MATRSLIGKQTQNGLVRNIYCHWDGYPEHNGYLLMRFYNTPEKVDQLLDLGNLSSLGQEIGEKQDFNDHDNHNRNWCLAYGRDRGGINEEATFESYDGFLKSQGIDYIYLYTLDNKWECYRAHFMEKIDIAEHISFE